MKQQHRYYDDTGQSMMRKNRDGFLFLGKWLYRYSFFIFLMIPGFWVDTYINTRKAPFYSHLLVAFVVAFVLHKLIRSRKASNRRK